MQRTLARHDAITRQAVQAHNGRLVKTMGDGLHAVFGSPADGVRAALAMQLAMGREAWPQETGPLKIRAGLHTGESQERAGDYFGSAVNAAARVMDLGHGGQVLLSEVTMLLVRGQLPAECGFTDLGYHRLRGLAQPEQIYQLTHPGLVAEFPALRSPSLPKHNLPVDITPLVGREQEVEQLARLLHESTHALVTIVAPGGAGKSRLALELGRRMVTTYAHGVYFVELAPVSDSAGIIPAIAEAVGYQFQQGGRSQQQQVLDFLAQKEMLLILDNFEHLLDGAGMAATLLQAAAGLSILATSRARLGQAGETLFTLHGLSMPAASEAQVAGYAAVQLFVQAARRAQPDFALTAENTPAVALVCRLTDGMPLGILLAAAWSAVLSPAEIAQEIQQGLDILEAEGSDLPARQRSVRAVFEQAWGMMSAAEQSLFQKAAVFRGGFTRAAGQQVAGAGLRELQALVNKALFERSAEQGRFVIHELLRQFGYEKLRQSGLERPVCDAHAAYYLEFLAQQTSRLKGAEQLPTLLVMESDFDNIRQGWRHAVGERAYARIGAAMEALYLCCLLQSRLEEGKGLFREARAGLGPLAGESAHSVWLAAEIRFFETSDSRPVLQERLETALGAARARDDELEEAYCLATLATIAHYLDQEPTRAIEYYEAAVAIYRRLGEAYYLAQNLARLGEAYQLLGQTELTRQLVSEAYEIQQRIGDVFGEGDSIRALGMTAWQAGEYADLSHMDRLLALHLRTGYVVGQAVAHLFAGYMDVTAGRWEQGDARVRTALELALEVADFSTQAWCYATLAFAAAVCGDVAPARQYLAQAEAISTDPFRQTGAGNPFVQLQINLVRFMVRYAGDEVGGEIPPAAAYLLQPLQLSVMTNSQPYMSMLVALVALIYERAGRLERAAELAGLVSRQSDVAVGWLADYEPYRGLPERLAQRMGPEQLAGALQRGRELALLSAAEGALVNLQAVE